MSNLKFQIKDSTGWKDAHELMYSKFPEDKRRKMERCKCDCHTTPGIMHFVACCENGWVEVTNKRNLFV